MAACRARVALYHVDAYPGRINTDMRPATVAVHHFLHEVVEGAVPVAEVLAMV